MSRNRKARKREPEEIANDVAIVLQDERLTPNAVNAVIRNAIICWTEDEGKIVGCKHRSAGSVNADPRDLEHEHVVPKRVIREMLYDLDSPTTATVQYVFQTYAIACVVTKEEHRLLGKRFRARMPNEFKQTRDPFERYKQVGIRVLKRNGDEVEIVC